MEGKNEKSIWKGIKRISMIGMASEEARKQANKQKGKQARRQTKGGVHNFIVLNYGWHTSKQDSCMDM